VGRRARLDSQGAGDGPDLRSEWDDRVHHVFQQLFVAVEPNNSNRSGTVKLEAARQYRYDLKLSEFNNQPPEVSQIEGMVKSMSPVK
jgi:hypothetical protein